MWLLFYVIKLYSELLTSFNLRNLLVQDDRKPEIAATSRLFEETRELLEQMGLEIQELPGDQKPKYSTRIQSYRQELDRLAQEFRRPRYGLNAPNNSAFDETGLREELLVDSDMRAGLLNNTQRVERTGRRLQEGLRTAYETEEIGGQILSDLDHQRDTLQRSRDRLRHANADLSKSSRIISSMYRRMIQNRAVLVAIGALMLLVLLAIIYLALFRGAGTPRPSTISSLDASSVPTKVTSSVPSDANSGSAP
ncbi:unnamed protein product [Schistocephalus solidus]|uniref:t-SNARE coiled-coil homology domain-containing protein n=1 Tax=Schistocephalus solidus TaxID=70667 RepID=A0A183SPT1_SCHSO|nr:unnamed protein product [Schistocephalus solidus]